MRAVTTTIAVLAVVLTASACQVEVDVAVEVNGGGDGTIAVSVGLDDEVLAALGDVNDIVVDDLVERGWRIDEPERRSDGLTWLTAVRAFDSIAEGTAALQDISGPDGPFGRLVLSEDTDLLRTRYEFGGTVDLQRGIEAFGDEAFADRLGGTGIGWTVEELEAVAGRPLEEVVDFRVAVDLPGAVESNAPVPSPDVAVWQPRLGEHMALVATGERFNRSTLVWGAVALAALVALVVLATAATVRRGRRST